MSNVTTRNEPSVNGLLGLFANKKLTNEEIVNDALDAFEKAEAKMQAGIETIEANIQAEQEQIRQATARIESAANAQARLSRVIDRLKALTA